MSKFINKNNQSYGWVILTLLFVNVLFAFGSMNVVPPLFPEIMRDIPLTKAEMGTIIGVFNLATPVSLIGGLIADRLGSRALFTAAVLIMGVASALRFYADSAATLSLLMLIMGIGFTCYGPVIPKVLGEWFPPEKLAKANGLVFSAFGLGSSLALATATGVLSPALGGWQMTMAFMGLICIGLGIGWLVLFRTGPRAVAHNGQGEGIVDGLKHVFRIRDLWMLALFYHLFISGWFIILSFLPMGLEERGIPGGGKFVAIMMLTSVAFNVIGGIVSDNLGKRKPVLIGGAILLAISTPALLTLSGPLLIAALILAGAGIGAIIPVATAMPVEMRAVGTARAGTALGVMFMIGNSGGLVGPIVAGKLMDITGSAYAGFAYGAIGLLVGVLLVWQMKETGPNGPKSSLQEAT